MLLQRFSNVAAKFLRDTIPPTVYGIAENGVYQEATITFDEGTALLNGNAIYSGTSVKGTGVYHLILSDASFNSTEINFKILHLGDVNGDGEINVYDLALVKAHLLKANLLEGIYMQAADVDISTTISISDLLKIKKYLLGIISL